ncbi:hypothetical protein QFZ77_004712 [Paenibacillus sp. V4I3]|uniref:hypothetical protein n=1 Tax=Paenibacillus sp. V4I3 TaxID=3042305 RepID=UPI00277DD6D6|nr:hypothetical protein [Paenibacillus sp. V4I3]MDQ0876053.1 hypothetical protein [Paenibacillus sp. V4I3]
MTLEEKLYNELTAQNNSFLIGIRGDITWEHQKFIDLIELMRDYILKTENNSIIEREFLKGYRYLSRFIPQWTSHDNFRRNNNNFSTDYYETAYKLISLLYNWFVNGSVFETIQRNKNDYEEHLNKLTSLIKEDGYNS